MAATLLRRLKDLSTEHIAAYRNNALAFTLKQNLGKYLVSKTVTSEQLDVKGALSSVRLSELEFDTSVLNEMLDDIGFLVERLSVRSVILNLSEVRCSVSGIDLVVRPRQDQSVCDGGGISAADPVDQEGLPDNPSPIPPPSPGRQGEQSPVLGSLTLLLDELFGLLNSYLEINFIGTTVTALLPRDCKGGYVPATLRIPEFVFRDGVADHFNTATPSATAASSLIAQHKILTVSTFTVHLGEKLIVSADAGVAVTVRMLKDSGAVSTSVDVHVGVLRLSLHSSQIDELAAILRTLGDASSPTPPPPTSHTPPSREVESIVNMFRPDAGEEERAHLSELYRNSVSSMMRASEPEFFDCDDGTAGGAEDNNDDKTPGDGSDNIDFHLGVAVDFTRGVILSFTDDVATGREVVFRTGVCRADFSSTENPQGEKSVVQFSSTKLELATTGRGDTLEKCLAVVSVGSHEKAADSEVEAAEAASALAAGAVDARACSFKVELSREMTPVETFINIRQVDVNMDLETMSHVLTSLERCTALQTNTQENELVAFVCNADISSIFVSVPLQQKSGDVFERTRGFNGARWVKSLGTPLLVAGPSLLCQLNRVSARVVGGGNLGEVAPSPTSAASAAVTPTILLEVHSTTAHLCEGANLDSVELRIIEVSELRVSSSSPTEDSKERIRETTQAGSDTPNARAWEPDDTRPSPNTSGSSRGAKSRAMADDVLAGAGSALYVSLSQCTLNVARSDAVALVCLFEKIQLWSQSIAGTPKSSAPPVVAVQAPSPSVVVVCHCTSSMVATFSCTAAPQCVQLSVFDPIVVIGSAGLDVLTSLRGIELACADPCEATTHGKRVWDRIVERTPKTRGTPSAVVDQDMVSLRLGNAGKCSIRVASTIFKIPPNFLWVDEIIETQLAIVALNGATSAPPAERKAERLVLVVTCEDIKIEGPQTPQSVTNEVGSQAVLDIVRVSMSTVAMVPTAPLQHYSIVADQVRVLFAKKSPPFSAKTEHNFLELVLLPGERALNLHVSVDNNTPAHVEVDVGVSDLIASFCADTLAAVLGHATALSAQDQQGSADSSIPKPAVDRAVQEDSYPPPLKINASRGNVSDDGEARSLSSLSIGEPLDLLPCIDEYFNSEPAESQGFLPGSSFSSSAAAAAAVAESLEPLEKSALNRVGGVNHEEEEGWVMGGFHDSTDASELGTWKSFPETSLLSESEDSSLFPKGDMQKACWYDEARSADLKPHYMPLPEKETRLASRLAGSVQLDVHVAVRSASIRLFDGFDWERGGSAAEDSRSSTMPSASNKASTALQKPKSLLMHVDQSYVDGFGGSGGGGSGGGSSKGGGDGSGGGGDRSHLFSPGSTVSSSGHLVGLIQSSRKTDRVVSISVADAQVRYSVSEESAEGPLSHLRVVGDLAVSQSISGGTQNCLYEWKSLRQAREEVDESGYALKMVSIEVFGVRPSSGMSTGIAEHYTADVRIRPLRVAATWDLVDFLRAFSLPSQEDWAADAEFPRTSAPGGGVDDSRGLHASPPPPGPRLVSASIHSVRLKIDFDTRLVDLEAVQQGDMLELLKLFPLSGVELQLQQVACAPSSDEEPDGTALAAFLARTLHSWVRDITSSQLHHFFAGAGVMRPITSVGKTAANVILLPLEQYRRENGRVLYALRRGAMDFVKTVMVESLSATAALAHCFASGLSFLSEANPHSAQSLVSERPDGVHSGVASARSSLHRGVNTASHAIIAVPLDSYHRNGARGALKTTVRAIPVAVLAPVIGASEALSFTLMGIRNTMDPERRHDDDAKYKHGKNKASSSVL